jgi:hypothetical protein
MKKFIHFYCLLALSVTFSFTKTFAQCVVTSSNGYSVTMDVRPVSVIKPATCPYGYNYNINFLYNVTLSGTNIPANLYTLQGNIYCDGEANFFSLPKNGGTGTRSTVSNPYRSTTDCATVTPSSLKCRDIKISIEGPGIPPQTIDCIIAGSLPVSYISFNGRIINNSNVYLNWITASETNNKSFNVERSEDGFTWTTISHVSGAVNSATNKEYSFTDEGLKSGLYYYRLKQADINGSGSYSNIIAANITKGNEANEVSVFYSSNNLQFTGLGSTTKWELVVFNSASARVLVNQTMTSSTVLLPNLSDGIYFIKLRNKLDNTVKTIKFFKG